MHSVTVTVEKSTTRLLQEDLQARDGDGSAQHKKLNGCRDDEDRKCSPSDNLESLGRLQEISILSVKSGTQHSMRSVSEDIFNESVVLSHRREASFAPGEPSFGMFHSFMKKELSENKKSTQEYGKLSGLENFPSSKFSGKISKASFKSPTQILEGDSRLNVTASGKHMKNVVVLGVIMTLLFVALSSIRQGKTSLDNSSIAGLISLAVGFTLGSIISVVILQTHQLHLVIFSCLVFNLFNLCSYMYPVTWLVVLLSLIQGISMAFLCNSVSSYVTFMIKGEAQRKGKHFNYVSGLFFGFFFAIFQNHQTISSLTSSLLFNVIPSQKSYLVSTVYNNNTELVVLENYPPAANGIESLGKAASFNKCGSNFNIVSSAGHIPDKTQDQPSYILCAFYFTCLASAIIITTCYLERVNTKNLYESNTHYVEKIKLRSQSFLHLIKTRNFLLMFPLLMYSLMQFGFLLSDLSLVYIVCPLDVVTLSYTMACFGICASVSGFISGLISKYIGSVSLLTFAAVLNVIELLFLSEWIPSADSLIPYFVVVGVWGLAHGIWMTQVYYLTGVTFSERSEEAYAGLCVAQGLGIAAVAGMSSILSTSVKLYIMLLFCITALGLYIAMEILLKQKQQRFHERRLNKKLLIYTKV